MPDQLLSITIPPGHGPGQQLVVQAPDDATRQEWMDKVGNAVAGWKGTECHCMPADGFPNGKDCLSDNQCLEDSYCETSDCPGALLGEHTPRRSNRRCGL